MKQPLNNLFNSLFDCTNNDVFIQTKPPIDSADNANGRSGYWL